MKWIDSREIAIALAEAHPEVDPRNIRFTDLYNWIRALPQAIQMAWIDEA